MTPLARVFCIALIALGATSANAAEIDKTTGLPVNPSFKFTNTRTDEVCSTPVHLAVYSPFHPMGTAPATLKAVADWYAQHLKGFKRIEAADPDHPGPAFLNSDGTLWLGIVASGKTGVDSVVYGQARKNFVPMASLTSWLSGNAMTCP